MARGYGGINFRDLAATVGIKAASINYYFASKALLGEAVARRYWEDIARDIEAISTKTKSPAEALRQYQIVTEHEATHLVMEDTGLGFERTEQRVLIHMTTRSRSQAMKQAFYQTMTRGLAERCGIEPQDVMFSVIENSDADWSFAFGKAQFFTGDL